MFDIGEIHTILEEALRPVFRIDRTEKKKKKIMKKRGHFENFENNAPEGEYEEKPQGMSSEEDEEDEILDQLSMSTDIKSRPKTFKDKK